MKTILIVEDNPTISAAYQLKFKEFNLIFAKNGEEGLKLTKTNPDLIILDIMMPVMNGEEFLEKVEKTCPIIVITNSTNKYNGKADVTLRKVDTTLSKVYDTITQYL